MSHKSQTKMTSVRARLANLRLPKVNYRRLEAMYGWLFISPVLVGVIVFALGPIIYSLILSGQTTIGVKMGAWSGLANYKEMMGDPMFWKSIEVTFKYALGVVPISVAIQLIVAAALNQGFRATWLYRLVYYLPAITPVVATILVWMYIFDGRVGLANWALHAVGLPKIRWLETVKYALPSFGIIAIWAGVGPGMVLFLAGLQGISAEYYEAAEIDGAGALAKFRHITIPLVSPITFLTLVLGLIGALQAFDAVYVATRGDGSPFHSTLLMGLYIYKNAFQRMRFGYASAIAWVMGVIILILTYVQFRLQRRWVHYGG